MRARRRPAPVTTWALLSPPRKRALWATAQACPVRRVIVDGTLQLAEWVLGVGMGYSSGGFIANVEVRGPTVFASHLRQSHPLILADRLRWLSPTIFV